MITIIEIARQIELGKQMKKVKGESSNNKNWKPQECVDYVLPQVSIPIIRSKKYTREKTGESSGFY